jgi:hypothetical protein
MGDAANFSKSKQWRTLSKAFEKSVSGFAAPGRANALYPEVSAHHYCFNSFRRIFAFQISWLNVIAICWCWIFEIFIGSWICFLVSVNQNLESKPRLMVLYGKQGKIAIFSVLFSFVEQISPNNKTDVTHTQKFKIWNS